MRRESGSGRWHARRPQITSTAVAGLTVCLAACGGGNTNVSNTGSENGNTYTIGGGITGLTTQGLVLANGSDSVSPNPGDLSFVFENAVAAGTAYNVIVQLQPDGLTCSVSNGSGTVGSANVSSISIACVPATYSVGGTISGLTASGLVLANGGNTVSPASGATTFTFPTAVPADTAFNVTIATQPTGLTCTVTNGVGVVLTSSVNNVAVNCQ
jgi:hypothetical protein